MLARSVAEYPGDYKRDSPRDSYIYLYLHKQLNKNLLTIMSCNKTNFQKQGVYRFSKCDFCTCLNRIQIFYLLSRITFRRDLHFHTISQINQCYRKCFLLFSTLFHKIIIVILNQSFIFSHNEQIYK